MTKRRAVLAGLGMLALAACSGTTGSITPTGAEIDTSVNTAIADMNARLPFTTELANRAVAMLVMPSIYKGSFVVGGAYGEGALRLAATGYTQSAGYYAFASGSVGYQAGVQKTGHALFFMTPEALDRFRTSPGWEAGADAEVTLVDTGLKAELNTTAAQRPVIAVVFSQQGLAAGASLEGAKYTPVTR